MKLLFSTIVGLAAVLLASCASVTPQTRIDANPGIYQSLSDKERTLVRTGQITKGMKPPAVFLAWGAPDEKTGGQADNESFESWTYTRSQPVTSTSFGPYIGYGNWYRRGYYSGVTLSPRVYYRQEPYAKVEFRRGKVVSWERRTR